MSGRRIEYLDHGESLGLVGECRIGRVGVTVNGVAHIVPVTYVMLDGDLFFRSGAGTKLEAAVSGQSISFEVDRLDDATETGWSVLLSGDVEVVHDPALLSRIDELGLVAWAPGRKEYVLRLRAVMVSGRRIIG